MRYLLRFELEVHDPERLRAALAALYEEERQEPADGASLEYLLASLALDLGDCTAPLDVGFEVVEQYARPLHRPVKRPGTLRVHSVRRRP
jgi:hypothetical protein